MNPTTLQALLTNGRLPRAQLGARLLSELRPIIDGGILAEETSRRSTYVIVVDQDAFAQWVAKWDDGERKQTHMVVAVAATGRDQASGLRSVPLSCVHEREIDVMLTEEVTCNPAIAAWFAARAGIEEAELSHAGDSVWDDERETDLLIVYGRPRTALLVENKITAPLSADQAEHYRVRGDLGVTRGDWDSYLTCIMAPAAWLSAVPQHGFDIAIPYEEIAKAIGSADPRADFRRRMLLQGAARAQARVVVAEGLLADQISHYRRIGHEIAPELGTARCTGFTMTTWKGHAFRTELGKKTGSDHWINLVHRIPKGEVNITIGSATLADVAAAIGDVLPEDWNMKAHGDAVEIYALVPAIEIEDPLEGRREDLENAFDILTRMQEFVVANADRFASIPRTTH